MDCIAQLKTDAEKVLPPLMEEVRKLEKQQLIIANRLANERDDLARALKDIEEHKGRAAVELAKGGNDYRDFQARLRRLLGKAEVSRESLALLDQETRPAVDRELEGARVEVHRALLGLVAGVKGDCERTMAEHIGAAVDERAAFMVAARELFESCGMPWTGETSDHEKVFPEAHVFRPRDAAFVTVHALTAQEVDRHHIPTYMLPASEKAVDDPQAVEAPPEDAHDAPERAEREELAPGAAEGVEVPPVAPSAAPPEKRATLLGGC